MTAGLIGAAAGALVALIVLPRRAPSNPEPELAEASSS